MSGLEVCFTGFAKQTRSDLEQLATDSGFIVRKAVTRNLHILCAGGNAGPKKVADAKADGAAILLESEFIDLVKTGALSEENFTKLSELLSKRDNAFRSYQFERYQANFDEDFLKSQYVKFKQTACTQDLPYIEQPTIINFIDKFICFTGDFRAHQEREVLQAVSAYKGAFIDNDVTLRTQYLVVGSAWSHMISYDPYGAKIEKALSLKECGREIFIISEAQWLAAL
ncbi:hypothetical protein KVP08_009105 [Shewanella putrefaciens]|nr:hypothetical protein KVP08_009105 [Shewanella putrefaciens]